MAEANNLINRTAKVQIKKPADMIEPVLFFFHTTRETQAPPVLDQGYSSHASGEGLLIPLPNVSFPTWEHPRDLTAVFSLWRNTSVAMS